MQEQRVDTHIPGKILGRPFDGRLRAGARYCLGSVRFGGGCDICKNACNGEQVYCGKQCFDIHLSSLMLSMVTVSGPGRSKASTPESILPSLISPLE